MRKKGRMFLAILMVICMALFGIVMFTKKANLTDYDVGTYIYEEKELDSNNKLSTFSENYVPTEN